MDFGREQPPRRPDLDSCVAVHTPSGVEKLGLFLMFVVGTELPSPSTARRPLRGAVGNVLKTWFPYLPGRNTREIEG